MSPDELEKILNSPLEGRKETVLKCPSCDSSFVGDDPTVDLVNHMRELKKVLDQHQKDSKARIKKEETRLIENLDGQKFSIFEEGREEGQTEGYDIGYREGYDDGHETGYLTGRANPTFSAKKALKAIGLLSEIVLLMGSLSDTDKDSEKLISLLDEIRYFLKNEMEMMQLNYTEIQEAKDGTLDVKSYLQW